MKVCERSGQIVRAENLNTEIDFRCKSLLNKYEQKLEDLTDYQILEISQDKNLDLEFNGALERELRLLPPLCLLVETVKNA